MRPFGKKSVEEYYQTGTELRLRVKADDTSALDSLVFKYRRQLVGFM